MPSKMQFSYTMIAEWRVDDNEKKNHNDNDNNLMIYEAVICNHINRVVLFYAVTLSGVNSNQVYISYVVAVATFPLRINQAKRVSVR